MFFRRDKMQTIIFSYALDTIDELVKRHSIKNVISCYDLESVKEKLEEDKEYLLIVDYDSVAKEFNTLLSANEVPNYTIVLEREPEIVTGKMLISHSIKAYGNLRMQSVHFKKIIQTLRDGDVWTYPELTAALIQETKRPLISDDSKTLIEKRLSPKEQEVIYLLLEGLTNDAISKSLNITVRTIKSHISSIFSKLHVNDRISLVLLLR